MLVTGKLTEAHGGSLVVLEATKISVGQNSPVLDSGVVVREVGGKGGKGSPLYPYVLCQYIPKYEYGTFAHQSRRRL
jgi:hypothetical protein